MDQSFTKTERGVFIDLSNVAQVVKSRLTYAVYLFAHRHDIWHQHHGRRKGSYIYGKRGKKEEEEGLKKRNEEIKEGSNDGGGESERGRAGQEEREEHKEKEKSKGEKKGSEERRAEEKRKDGGIQAKT